MCDITVRIKEEIIQYARQYRVEKVYLFGSRANGTNQVKSDIAEVED
ncbi:MAG: polymerase beta, Nucleotidyltransferase [Clostridiales bacterium]|nr:polymerase beta, Nucleotidyltransferase [Clostridiales bacterium]